MGFPLKFLHLNFSSSDEKRRKRQEKKNISMKNIDAQHIILSNQKEYFIKLIRYQPVG
jgi:hypothetical protein